MIENCDLNFPNAHSLLPKILRFVLSKKNQKFSYEPFSPDILLNIGDTLKSYGFEGEIIDLKGHTEGSIGLIYKESLFIGDAGMVMRDKLSVPIFGTSMEDMKTSIDKLTGFDIGSVYCGH